MATVRYRQYRVEMSRDRETRRVVARVPALGIGDYGPDSAEALRQLEAMVAFHLERLTAEGKAIPQEEDKREGLYLRVRLPARAA